MSSAEAIPPVEAEREEVVEAEEMEEEVGEVRGTPPFVMPTERQLVARILSIAWPCIASVALNFIQNTVLFLMVARFGGDECVAAVGVTYGIIMMTEIGFGWGVCSVLDTLVSQEYGRALGVALEEHRIKVAEAPHKFTVEEEAHVVGKTTKSGHDVKLALLGCTLIIVMVQSVHMTFTPMVLQYMYFNSDPYATAEEITSSQRLVDNVSTMLAWMGPFALGSLFFYGMQKFCVNQRLPRLPGSAAAFGTLMCVPLYYLGLDPANFYEPGTNMTTTTVIGGYTPLSGFYNSSVMPLGTVIRSTVAWQPGKPDAWFITRTAQMMGCVVFVQTITLLVLILCNAQSRYNFDGCRCSFAWTTSLKPFLKIAAATVPLVGGESCAFSLMLVWSGMLRPLENVIYLIRGNIGDMMFAVYCGTSNAVNTLVGNAVGEKQPALAKKSTMIGMQVLLMTMLINDLIYAVNYPWIYRWFTNLPGARAVEDQIVIPMLLFHICDMSHFGFLGLFCAIGRNFTAGAISLAACYFVALPLAYYNGGFSNPEQNYGKKPGTIVYFMLSYAAGGAVAAPTYFFVMFGKALWAKHTTKSKPLATSSKTVGGVSAVSVPQGEAVPKDDKVGCLRRIDAVFVDWKDLCEHNTTVAQ